MADHSKPSVTSSYANYTAEIDARFDDLAVGLDPAVTTATNILANSIRYSSASNKWQKWNGSTWGDLSSNYAINITGSAGSVDWSNVQNKPTNIVQDNGNTYGINISGSAASLTTARTINGVSFNGTANINVNTNNVVTFNSSGSGNTSGTTFDGSSARTVSYNTIGAPSIIGTNASGTWGINVSGSSASCSGNAVTATSLQTARNINGVSFNGTGDIVVEPYVETDSANASRYITFVDSNSAGYQRLNLGSAAYNPSTNTLTCNIIGNVTGNVSNGGVTSVNGQTGAVSTISTSTDRDETNFPVGTCVMVSNAAADNRNAVRTIYFNTGYPYLYNIAGDYTLVGTWRHRGGGMFQRTA